MNKKKFRGWGLYVLIMLVIFAIVSLLLNQNHSKQILYSDVVNDFEQEKVQEFVINDGTLTMLLKDGTTVTYTMDDTTEEVFYQDLGDLIHTQLTEGIIKSYNYEPKIMPWWTSIIPYVVMIGLFMLFWMFMFNRQDGGGRGAMQFGKSRAKIATDQNKKTTFKDVAGEDEEKAELEEIVEFLKNPVKFTQIGARIPKGVLLVGPPGTGKTLLAKAVAGEAGVPFLSISGSDFVELYVGVGASRVRDLFEQAKKNAPAIIFIDEIDAVGRQRGAGLGGGHDEREQTLNQLLVEMDGFGANEGVIVIAATNRPDILDKALLRPGRFDRQVYVGAPDVRGREEILDVHARNKQFDPDVDFSKVARSTAGFTGADLENLLNEAALLAARRSKKFITQDEIEESILKVEMGSEKKTRVITDDEKRLTAYHEAGHAIAFHVLPTQDSVHHITIIPRSNGAGGFTMPIPSEEKHYYSRTFMQEYIIVCLAGRVAEQLVLKDISTGASNDIKQATSFARSMVTTYGMSDRIGPVDYSNDNDHLVLGKDLAMSKIYSDETAFKIDEEIHTIIAEAYKACEKILKSHMTELKRIAEYLICYETVNGDTFRKLYNGEEIESPVVDEQELKQENKISLEKNPKGDIPDLKVPEASDIPEGDQSPEQAENEETRDSE